MYRSSRVSSISRERYSRYLRCPVRCEAVRAGLPRTNLPRAIMLTAPSRQDHAQAARAPFLVCSANPVRSLGAPASLARWLAILTNPVQALGVPTTPAPPGPQGAGRRQDHAFLEQGCRIRPLVIPPLPVLRSHQLFVRLLLCILIGFVGKLWPVGLRQGRIVHVTINPSIACSTRCNFADLGSMTFNGVCDLCHNIAV